MLWKKRIKKREKNIKFRKYVFLAGLMALSAAGCGWRRAGTEPEDSSIVRQFIIGPEEEAVYLVSAAEEAGIQDEGSALESGSTQENISKTENGSVQENVSKPGDGAAQENVSEAEKDASPEENSGSEEETVQTVSGNAAEGLSEEANEVLAKVNQARLEIGLSELVWSDELAAAAEIRAQEIHQAFSHTRPDGSPWWTVDSENIYGENIAKGYQSADSVVEAWMESTDHKENILYSGFETIGIAVYNVDGKWYWAQEFGY